MDILENFEHWARKTYSPKEASWKKPALFLLSLLIAATCIVSAYMQINYTWTNDGIWILIVMFSLFSALGLIVSIFSKDFWVALVFGGI